MAKSAQNSKLSKAAIEKFRGEVLEWYDRHRRILPWRLEKSKTEQGVRPDPYHVWLSEIMLQQTTVGAVKPYFEKFLALWPTVQDLATAPQDDVMSAWAGLGYYARARNLHKCAKVVSEELSGVFPCDIKALRALPGIGEYTSAAIMTIAFNKPATVVDGNIERIMARYFAVEAPLPKSKPQLKALAALFFEGYEARPGDLAQCLMDIGATICIPKTPRCSLCPIADKCQGRIQGIAETLPRKEKKKPRPRRFGYVYWIENEQGDLLLHKRPEKGLLGGMIALPSSEWIEHAEGKSKVETSAPPPIEPEFILSAAHYTAAPQSIHHIFTHFELELQLRRGAVEALPVCDQGGTYMWLDRAQAKKSGFPSLFQKAFKLFTV